MKKIMLTENQLHKVIKESVRKIIREIGEKDSPKTAVIRDKVVPGILKMLEDEVYEHSYGVLSIGNYKLDNHGLRVYIDYPNIEAVEATEQCDENEASEIIERMDDNIQRVCDRGDDGSFLSSFNKRGGILFLSMEDILNGW